MMEFNAPGKPSELIPAATIMLLRQGGDGVEVLMLRRNRDLKAFGGAWVFPGGRVDGARHAAIRETSEETGLDIAATPMAPLSIWIPPAVEIRRFSTWFFVAEAPDAAVQIDQGEIHDYQWIKPADMLSKIPDPAIKMMPPTYISLYQIQEYGTPGEVVTALTDREPDFFRTRFKPHGDGFATYWEGDAAYECGDLDRPGPRRRLLAGKERWDYICDL